MCAPVFLSFILAMMLISAALKCHLLSPETIADRISVDSNFPDFVKWSISPKASLLLSGKMVLSPSGTQCVTGCIKGYLFQKHIEHALSGGLFIIFYYYF